jgi:hypothetical protein
MRGSWDLGYSIVPVGAGSPLVRWVGYGFALKGQGWGPPESVRVLLEVADADLDVGSVY